MLPMWGKKLFVDLQRYERNTPETPAPVIAASVVLNPKHYAVFTSVSSDLKVVFLSTSQ